MDLFKQPLKMSFLHIVITGFGSNWNPRIPKNAAIVLRTNGFLLVTAAFYSPRRHIVEPGSLVV